MLFPIVKNSYPEASTKLVALKPNYRPDIDGLRACAVAIVVLYHAFPKLLPGGFIGVDVFFVISGYLISTLIIENLANESFGLGEFYSRRMRRIFPALGLVLLTSLTLAWFILTPAEYKQLGKHAAAGAGFVSNIVFWNEAGYFDTVATQKPLLHLWSLGVEEQFYILWPALLWLAWRKKINLLRLLAICTLASFALSIRETETNSVAAFYSLPTRLWELSSGSLLALAKLSDVRTSKLATPIWNRPLQFLRDVASIIGLLLLLAGAYTVHENYAFPGWWAALPAASAILIMASGKAAFANRIILANPLCVWLGLISYPLYLWHWPLLTLTQIWADQELSTTATTSVLLISIMLSLLTFKYVESPIRSGRFKFDASKILIPSMLTIGSLGLAIFALNGIPSRFPLLVQRILQTNDDRALYTRKGTCFLNPEQSFKNFVHCDDQPSFGKESIVLWGDSHAAFLWPGINASFGQTTNLYQRTASGCPPIVGLVIKHRQNCKLINDEILAWLKQVHPNRIIIAAHWTTVPWQQIEDTIAKIRDAGMNDIIVVGPVPIWEKDLPKLLYSAYKSSKEHVVPKRMSAGLNKTFFEVDQKMRVKMASLNIQYISPRDILCDSNGCLTVLDNTEQSIVTFDYGHLTKAGAEYLVSKFPDF